MNDIVQLADFEPFLNQTFQIRFHPTVTMEAELIEAILINSYQIGERAPFSIVLRTAQKGEYFLQATYVLIHPIRGELEVFLVPLGPDEKGMLYEAIFG